MLTPQPTTDKQHLPIGTLKKSLSSFSSKGVLARVNLGSPSKSCLGVGICKIDLLSLVEKEKKSVSRCSIITILEKQKGDRLSIHFRKDSLSPHAKETHFHDHTFIVEENYTLSTSIVKRFGCQPTIYKGFYRVKETEQFLTITF